MFVSRIRRGSFVLLAFPVFLVLLCVQNSLASVITGVVYDQQRNPVVRVDVELLNENRTVLNRTRTNGIGRYEFNVVIDAIYYVRVLPFRTNLEDQIQEVRVETLSQRGQGTGYFMKDFYLKRKKGGLSDTTTGVLFAQEVPKEAELLHKLAVEDLSNKKKSDGVKKLVKALKIYPNYYLALKTLGIELLTAKQNMEAAKLFMRAAQVNPKSSKAFYYMGFAFSKVGKAYHKAALASLKKASVLAPASFEVPLLAGKIERKSGNFQAAEKELLRAKKLAGRKVPDIHAELAQLYGNDLKQYGKAADELELYLKASNKKDKTIKMKIADLRSKARSRT